MEVLNWAAEHYFLAFWAMLFAARAVSGLGRIGSTTIRVERQNEDS